MASSGGCNVSSDSNELQPNNGIIFSQIAINCMTYCGLEVETRIMDVLHTAGR